MQSFKPTLNRCKAPFFTPFTSLASSPASAAMRCPLPTASHPCLLQSQCAGTVVTQRLLELPGPASPQVPKAKPSLPCLGAGGQLHPTATAQEAFVLLLEGKRHFSFCCVLRFLSWACKAGWAAPWVNPAHLGQHMGFVKTPTPTDVYRWSSHYPSTHWHDRLSIYRVNNHQINGL